MIFSPEQMWQAAVEQMGTEHHGWKGDIQVVMLYNGQDVAELYKALQEAHWRAVELNERLV